jgi:hypothetical protein
MKATTAFALVAIAVPAASTVGCKKDPPVTLAESASALSASLPPPSAKIVVYDVDPASKTSIDMPGLKEHIVADTDGAAGHVDVDLMNLASSRGEVKVDLTTLKTHTFKDDHDASQTTHALNWLQVGDASSDAEKKANRYAVFALQSLASLSSTDLSKVAPAKEGSEDVRTITATVHGDFLVHGHKAPKGIPVEVKFHYPSGAAADSKPTKIDIKSTSPLRVTLKEHDVHPRDTVGTLTDWTTSLVSKVAETADITLDLHATLKN